MRKLIPLFVGLLLLGGGCSSGQKIDAVKPISVVDEKVVRQEVETAHAKLIASIEAKDYEGYLQAFELPPERLKTLTKEYWLGLNDVMKKNYKPLSEGMFRSIHVSGDHAYYFQSTHPEDPAYLTLEVVHFKKSQGSWRLQADGTSDSTLPRDKDDKVNDATIDNKIAAYITQYTAAAK